MSEAMWGIVLSVNALMSPFRKYSLYAITSFFGVFPVKNVFSS
tara:strand:- start:93979 stop:94107 length:129 start_codon:yes stop_codon:yes gene_type:complete